ncbi:MAG: M28 family metallopeptidase [candidate division KSB1 bacterium]|nr:M28 family metallopeptidase [candidate division KSB1 bacterium]
MRCRRSDWRFWGLAFVWFAIPMTLLAQDWEQHILQVPQPDSCKAYLFRLTEEPHVAGTEEDFQVVQYIKNRLIGFGLQPEIVAYDVYLPYPRAVRMVITRPDSFVGPTPEAGFPVDKDSYASNVFPGFNAYSPGGEAQAQVVYVNYGRPEDYDALRQLGVDVRGKIALARYGKVFRGVKAKVAEEHGAVGLLIYSDPADDGYMKGDVYPNGPYRPEFGVQRGSIQYMFLYPGDPLTPGVAATSEARRIDPAEAENLPAIPTLPISYGDARRIIQYLGGPNVPKGWQGGLPFAYHTGPGPAEVKIHVDMDYQIRPIWNVIARIPGSQYPDQWVVVGNHHDAWTYGAVDPSSGTAVVLEAARTFSDLVKQGYRPKRTIVFAFWDAEEYGLLGSTEWVEANREFLRNNAVAYVNIDVGVAGKNFGASATPGLKPLIQDILARVNDPKNGRPLLEQVWRAQNKKKKALPPGLFSRDSLYLRFGDLGSGSDYTAFFDHAGVPSLSMGFGGPYGVYHAIYDNFYWMSHFGDPEFLYHATMARIAALMVHRLANAAVVPFHIAQYAREMLKHAEKLQKQFAESGVPDDIALTAILETCRDWLSEAESLGDLSNLPGDLNRDVVNEMIMDIERAFLDEKGLPGRSWYKHQLFAPGLYTGYASRPYPGLYYYFKRKNWDKLASEIVRVQERLAQAVKKTRELRELLQSAGKH